MEVWTIRKQFYMLRVGIHTLIRGGYSVEVSGSDSNKVPWEVVEDHVSEEEN